MTTKRYECLFCSFSTPFETSLNVHLNRYHEAVLAARGNELQRQAAKAKPNNPPYLKSTWYKFRGNA